LPILAHHLDFVYCCIVYSRSMCWFNDVALYGHTIPTIEWCSWYDPQSTKNYYFRCYGNLSLVNRFLGILLFRWPTSAFIFCNAFSSNVVTSPFFILLYFLASKMWLLISMIWFFEIHKRISFPYFLLSSAYIRPKLIGPFPGLSASGRYVCWAALYLVLEM
jgi:hypothetical protein